MQEQTIKEQLNKINQKEPIALHPLLTVKSFAWFILALSVVLMFIENFLKMDELVGGWHIVSYVLVLMPLGYMAFKRQLNNSYVKWFFPLLFIMIVDMFYYSNMLVQYGVPIIFYILVMVLYITSMHKVHSFYQTLIPNSFPYGFGVPHIGQFFENLFVKSDDNEIYKRIGLALLITLPFLGVFMALLFSADKGFATFLTSLVDFSFNFDATYIWTVPWYLFFYLLLFIFTLSASKNRTNIGETKSFDMLIIGIFLGMINLLFLTFILMQLSFLFGEANLPRGVSLAGFAREGFFQLMMVMGLVMLIFIFIMRRFKGEKLSVFFLGALLVQTIIMGLVSLKKMYLYQSIKGATVLRYYVEWFDYFLILVLLLGLVFLIRKIAFSKLLDSVSVLALVAFALIISLNVDEMVASHNIEKFKDKIIGLDKRAISQLSIDALPAIKGSDIIIRKDIQRDCKQFSNYHFGYCSKLDTFRDTQHKVEDIVETSDAEEVSDVEEVREAVSYDRG
ncbi:MAG TPA: DUF4173 domain-containing protein [Campylobacterales bacterium]|nr:DUF4173 domain-containing protein [Campylobacterales bacterium]